MQGDHLYSRKYYWCSYFSPFLNTEFPIFPIFLFFWASWHCIPCKHSISIVHIFHVISFKAFCKFLRLRNSAWDFLGVNFCSRDFLGGFVGSLRDFFGFWCLPPFNHPHHLKSRVSPAPGGWESLFTRGTCLNITNIHAWPMRWASFWGRGVIGVWVYSRKYSNCLKCGNVNIKLLYMIH